MITLSIDEKDKSTLRITASYLLALAGDIHTEVTGDNGLPVRFDVGALDREYVTGTATFNASELAEAETLTNIETGPGYVTLVDPQPNAAAIFGGKPSDAPYIAGVGVSTIAPVDTTVTAPPTVELHPAPTTAPVAPIAVPPAASHANGVEIDTRGLPWDSRIHSRTKSKLANGEWKVARNTAPELVAQVEGELRAVMAIPSVGVATPPPLAPAEVVTAPPNTSVVPAPPATTANDASPSEATTFPELMTKVAAAVAAHKLTYEQVLGIVNAVGVQSLPLLIQRPDLVPSINASIDAQILQNGATV